MAAKAVLGVDKGGFYYGTKKVFTGVSFTLDDARTALVGAGLVNELKINWVWNPPWGPDKITDDGREQLRALGFTV